MRRVGRAGRLAVWVVVVVAVIYGLQQAGTGELAPPPLSDPDRWGAWLEGRDPVVAAVALLRLAAMAAAWYLVVASVVGAALRVCRLHRLVAVADRLTVPALRRMLVASLGLALASGGTPAFAAAGHLPAVVASAQPAPTSTSTSPGPPPTLTMHLLAPGESVQTAQVPVPAPVPPPLPNAPPAVTWTVRPGECFWSIAADVLARAWGRAPTNAEIVPYWRGMIEENRARLADRSNEHLIFPGQVFTVPAPPPSPVR